MMIPRQLRREMRHEALSWLRERDFHATEHELRAHLLEEFDGFDPTWLAVLIPIIIELVKMLLKTPQGE